MLEVQKYLRSGKTFDDLSADFGIKSSFHPEDPLVILNYDQIESPKTNTIVRECRALTLETTNFDVVARSFSRFFNWGEVQDEMKYFDFTNFNIQSKEDGSLVLIYYFDGKWRANTRGSFADSNMQFQDFTWHEGICKAFGSNLQDAGLALNKDFTYVCEFVSPWNKVVRKYDNPALYLLTMFDPKENHELSISQVDSFADVGGFLRPDVYTFSSIDEIQDYLLQMENDDSTFEGVVIRDSGNRRWKLKSSTYLGLHKLRGNDNIWNPKHLLTFVLSGEGDELLTYFPEAKEVFLELESDVLKAQVSTIETWSDHKDIKDQKEFALAVKDHPFSVLFSHLK